MAMYFLQKTVSGASAATPLSATRVPCASVFIEVHQSNNAIVWVGDSTVDETTGTGKRLEIPIDTSTVLASFSIPGDLAPNSNNLADIYIRSASSGQKVNVFYEVV